MKYNFDTSLGNLSQRVSKSLGSLLVSKLEKQGIPVTAEQWCVISMLYSHKQASQTDIGLFLGYDKVRVLRLIERLENEGIVERSTHVQDRRIKIVKLTEKGGKYYKQVEIHAKKTLEEATTGLTPGEVDLCLTFLKKVSENLEHASGKL
jgi:DNA-binding MarR family transcriptional regulator